MDSKVPAQLKLFNWISDLALDAPLVAGSWWLLFASSFSNDIPREIFNSLVPAVWTVYLFDRLFDASKLKQGGPGRKQFAQKHPLLLRSLLILAIGWTLTAALHLPTFVWLQVSIIATLTFTYFLVCRWKSLAVRFPIKESLIGFCFALGVGIPFESPENWIRVSALLVFGVLCWVNCLIISLGESDHDRIADPSAWFSNDQRTFPFIPVLTTTAVVVIFLLCQNLPPLLGGCLLISTIALFYVYRVASHRSYPMIQSLVDAALWIPGLLGFAANLVSLIVEIPKPI